MNILHITAHLGGGAGKAIVGMALHRIKGCRTRVILLEQPEKNIRAEEARNNGIDILIRPDIEQIKQLIEEADIVILNWWAHPLMAGFLSVFPAVPCRLIIWCHINGCTYPYLPARFLSEFDRIFFTSQYSYENELWSRVDKHVIRNKSEVIHGIGDFQPVSILPKTEYRNDKEFRVGYIGTLNYGKLTRNFVKYCEAAADKLPEIRFILVGDIDGAVVEDIKHSRIREKFELPGFCDNPEEYYPTFDAFGYLLNRENYATTENALIEAMSFGVPIIVKNNGVERCIIHDGENGYVIKDREEYAEELSYLRGHEDERERIGRQARAYVTENYSEEKNFIRFYSACLSVAGQQKKLHGFMDILGKDPAGWFLYFADKDGNKFREYLLADGRQEADMLKKCKPIFREKSKSSIFHFYKYYPQDRRLRQLADALGMAGE